MSLRLAIGSACFAAALLGSGRAAAQAPIDSSHPAWQPPQQPEPDRRFSMRVSIAGRVQGLYKQPVFGAQGELGFGARLRDGFLHVFGTLSYFRGETRYGVDVHHAGAGAAVEFAVADRVHLGVAPQLGVALVERVTAKELMFGVGAGADLLFSADVYQGDDGDGLFLGARAGAQWVFAPYYGGGLWFGYR